jgi:hypothetical protein
MKLNRLRTFFDMNNYFPGKLKDNVEVPSELQTYPDISPFAVSVDNIEFIDFKGSFPYRRFDGCENELVKDKTIAPQTSPDDTRRVDAYSDVERNQVLNYLFSNDFVSQKEVNELFETGRVFTDYRKWILLALKAEAKKPGSRAFSMAIDVVRKGLSEAESNVATYVKHQKGSSQGKAIDILNQRMAELAKTPDANEYLNLAIMSFDLEGFSPMQNPKFKAAAFSSWEYVFDMPDLYRLKDIFSETELVFDKFDVNDKMAMVGNDLEGFVGRINTAAHIDLMGYAIRKIRELGLSTEPGKLEVLIDDGLLRVNLDGENRDYPGKAKVQKATEVIAGIYAMSGNKISWDKTFVSQVLCQYLNEVFYDGVKVTPGAKAFMRIGKQQEIAIPTVVDELMCHASTTRGAITNGGDHRVCYVAYLFEVYKTFKRYGLKKLNDDNFLYIAFACFVPVGLGGFGLSSLYGLSTNEAFNSFQAGIANMKMICYTFPGYANFANTVLNSGVREMDAEAILRNPMAIRTNNRCLNMRRFSNVAKAIVINKSVNPVIKAQRDGAFEASDDVIFGTIENSKVINEVQRSRLWEISVNSYVESIVAKLQSSKTAANLLGMKKCYCIAHINKSEARVLLNEMASGKLVPRSF